MDNTQEKQIGEEIAALFDHALEEYLLLLKKDAPNVLLSFENANDLHSKFLRSL